MSEKFNRIKVFYNSDVQKLLKKHNINHYSTYSVMKPSIVERFNRTLKNNMWKHLYTMEITNGSTSCRVSYQITTRVSIEQLVCVLSIADRLLTMVYNHVKIATSARYKVSDSVRVSKFKIVFDKGYTSNWSTEVFKIIKM